MRKHIPMGDNGSWPEKLQPIGRFPVGGALFGEHRFVSSVWPDAAPPGEDWFMQEAGALIFWSSAEDAHKAVAQVEVYLDYILDFLSFQIQQPVKIVQLDVVDLTPPVRVGEMRDYISYPYPLGYMPPKLVGSVHMGTYQTVLYPQIPSSYVKLEKHVQRAVDWYVKSLHATTDADAFILLWISLEVLADLMGEKVAEATRLRCGHEIEKCPECRKQTASHRQGETLRAFLKSFGIAEDDVIALWRLRQIVHGAFRFDADGVNNLAARVQVLRAIVMAALKLALGVRPDQPPLVGFGGPAITPMVGIGGNKQITEWDVCFEDRSPVRVAYSDR
ncbi:hypothetical protein [Kutzneria sp. NPDC051319]|uniref:hypothetical protein n=1 Tax=Kutzneria sp. NPDC051319 TaxID=3155047 RepID=UPI0034325A4A